MADIIFLLDESYSMIHHYNLYIKGVNKFITTQKSINPDANFSMIKFNSQITPICLNNKINTLPEFTNSDYNPNGLTCLYDAIEYVFKIKSTKECKQVIVIILTDGEDTCSKNTLQDISRKISEVVSKGWVLVYIAANQNAQKIGHLLGIKICVSYKETEKNIDHVADVCSIAIGHAMYKWSGIPNKFCLLEIPLDVSDIMNGIENFTI